MRWFKKQRAGGAAHTDESAPEKLTCRDWTELVTDYVEGSLPRSVFDRIDRHLRKCTDCKGYLEQMRASIATVGRLSDNDLDAMPDAMRSALFEIYQQGAPQS